MVKRALVVLIALASQANADGYGFMTPSGNIFCNGSIEGTSEITCTIVERSGPPAMPDPGMCNGVWGHQFSLDAVRPARVECAKPPAPVTYTDIAPYGVTAQFGDITCRSERTGLTCRNPAGHGFFLSRRSQEAF